MAPHMLFEVEKEEGTLMVRFIRRSLDAEAARAACGQLSRMVSETAPSRLRLDFRDVGFLSGEMLGRLAGLHGEVRSRGGSLTLRNVCPPIYEIFRACRLHELLDIHPISAEEIIPPSSVVA